MHRVTWPSPHPTSSTRRGTAKMVLDQGKDLLLVFGVDTFGVALLPPCRVLFPQGLAEHQSEISFAAALPSSLPRRSGVTRLVHLGEEVALRRAGASLAPAAPA